ncbi:MAG: hypothetical protein IT449_16910 [Phycisphaerales bacterium]|nr:hypothetical protein [Phycisphaerales bacterium]
MKRLLMIATGAYPPSRGPGPLRALGFSRHLPEFGWEPVVLTLRAEQLGPSADMSLWERIPSHVEVHTVSAPEYWFRRRASAGQRPSEPDLSQATREIADGEARRQNADAARQALRGAPQTVSASARAIALLRQVGLSIFGPEIYPGWLLASALKAKSLASECHALFSSSPPFQNHIAARWVARMTGLPWVADFRDPYAIGTWHVRSNRVGRARAVRREIRVLRTASAVVVTTDAMRDLYLREVAGLSDPRIHVISNGYDEDQRERADRILATIRPDPTAPLALLHAGIFYSDETLEGLCKAMRLLIDEGRAALGDFQIELVGDVQNAHQRIIQQHGLAPCLALPGRVSQSEALERMCRADVLLVEAGENIAHYAIRAKLFEYMVARRPVLGLIEDGPTAELLHRTGMGICIRSQDSRKVADTVFAWLQEKRRGANFTKDRKPAAEFDRRRLTGKLAEIVDSCQTSLAPIASAPHARRPDSES